MRARVVALAAAVAAVLRAQAADAQTTELEPEPAVEPAPGERQRVLVPQRPVVRERGVERRERRTERDTDRLGWYVPDFVRLQTGGFVGMFVAGTGYAIFNDVLNLSAHYGYTPADHAGSDVHAVSFEALLRPLDFRIGDARIVPIYAGPGLLYAWGDEFFTRLPARYRDRGYYPPTSIHWTARAGIELDWVPPDGVFERHGLYYEVTMLDTFFNFYRRNPETMNALDMLAGAVGYRAAF